MTNAGKTNARTLLWACSGDASEGPAVWSMSLVVEMIVTEEPCMEWWANREQWPSHVPTRLVKRAIQRMVLSAGSSGKRAPVFVQPNTTNSQTIFSNNSVILNKQLSRRTPWQTVSYLASACLSTKYLDSVAVDKSIFSCRTTSTCVHISSLHIMLLLYLISFIINCKLNKCILSSSQALRLNAQTHCTMYTAKSTICQSIAVTCWEETKETISTD